MVSSDVEVKSFYILITITMVYFYFLGCIVDTNTRFSFWALGCK